MLFNPPLLVTESGRPSGEERFFALGRSHQGRHLFLVFTLRGELVRVISAGDVSRKERKAFESHG